VGRTSATPITLTITHPPLDRHACTHARTLMKGRRHGFQQAWEEAQVMFQESVRKRAEQGRVEIP
jgi:hypothetical protein